MTLRPYLLLLVLWGVYFHPLILHPTYTLFAPYSDLLAEHLPARIFLVREWRTTGELPLWNPYHFCGSPFVHDIQVGIFYPPYAVTYLFSESVAGAVMSWVIALHVLAAGWFTFIYARSNGLGETGSLVVAVGWMFAGKWMTHLLLAGHSITIGLAWLPLVLLGLERGARAGGVGPALGAGVALALLILGTHPQWTFYAGVFAAFWTLPVDRARASIRRWLLTGAGAVSVAVALTAVQLLPTLEAGGQSSRSGGMSETGSQALALRTFLGLAVPPISPREPEAWELYAAMGPCWIAAALAAGGLVRWRRLVFLGLVFFSAGGAVLVEWLPGFNLFRVPGRMLLIAGFPLAVLAGITTDALARTAWADPCRWAARRWLILFAVVFVLAALIYLTTVYGQYTSSPPHDIWPSGVVGWCALCVTVPVALRLFRSKPNRPTLRTAGWLAILLIDRVAPTVLLPEAYPHTLIDREPTAIRYLVDHLPPGTGRAMDVGSSSDDGGSLLGTGAPRALVYGVETIRGYNPLDVRHYREFLAFAAGVNEPLRANGPFTQQVIPNVNFPNRSLMDLAGLRYVSTEANLGLLWVGKSPAGWRVVAVDPTPWSVPPVHYHSFHFGHLHPQSVHENAHAFPRAWVVPEARPMPVGGEYEALLATDFRRAVLLTTDRPLPPPAAAVPTARVSEYRPNRVRVELAGDGGGFLVLADVWYPGWVCRVDGAEVPVERANHAFRAVELPAGAKEVVFAFEPRSYRVGRWISLVSLAGVTLAGAALLRRRPVDSGAAAAYPNPSPSPAGSA
ncbi:MAG TPA: hypothetical protein VH092_03290 [Urbifossiella sp.]|nr:hypothetical protein [Urbifossiella sp.]